MGAMYLGNCDRPQTKKPPTEMSEGFFYTMGNLQLVIGNESLPQLPTL
jgi:hypothetical protein